MNPYKTIVCGTKSVTASNTPEKLVSDPTPCRAVWIGPKRHATTGAITNTTNVMIGDASAQTAVIPADGTVERVYYVNDASLLYVRVVTGGQGVAYQIFD